MWNILFQLKRAISSESSDSDESNGAKSTSENHKNGQPDKKAKLANDKEKGVMVVKDTSKPKGKQIEEGNTKKEVKTTTVKDMLRAQRDNVIRNSNTDAANGSKLSSQAATTTDDSSTSSDSSDSSDDEDHDNEDHVHESDGNVDVGAKSGEKATEKLHAGEMPATASETNGEPHAEPVEVKLPENLPESLLQKIKQMEELVKTTPKGSSDHETHALLYE